MRLCAFSVLIALSCCCLASATINKLWDKKTGSSPNVQVVTVDETSQSHEVRHKVIRKPVFVDRCPRNEVWYNCLPSCPITCKNLYKECDPPKKCLKGCECARGYARERTGGPCVPVKMCSNDDDNDDRCERNEVYSTCGSTCQERCNDGTRVCPAVCEKGCFCRPGYVRKSGKCVRNDICLNNNDDDDKECDDNEVYKSCGYASDESCDSGERSSRCKAGCFCKRGYVRVGRKCVKDDVCTDNSNPRDCDRNEFWTKCGYACEDDCDDRNCRLERTCKPRCLCKRGYKRIGGVCVDDRKCRDNSGPSDDRCTRPNEVFKSSGRRCDERCEAERGSCGSRKPGCFCKSGYVRIDGVCVSARECKKFECGAHQSWKCSSSCKEKCNSKTDECGECSMGCFCNKDYTRESPLLDCVPRKETCKHLILPSEP